MQFKKSFRHPRQDEPTGRQLAAYERTKKRKQDALPLLAPLIAETQLPVAEEFERRRELIARTDQKMRDMSARHWRDFRKRLYDLPARLRTQVLARYHGGRMPRASGTLSYLLWRELMGVEVAVEEMPTLSQDARLTIIQNLNDRARQGDTWTRYRRAYSEGVMAFLAPGFQPSEDADRPHVVLDVSRGRASLLCERVASYDDFTHNSDPSGERRTGYFEVLGTRFRFEVLYLNTGDDGPATVPWNLDLSRRWVWFGLEDEAVDLSTSAVTDGWCWTGRSRI